MWRRRKILPHTLYALVWTLLLEHAEAYDESLKMNWNCKERCDNHRQPGWREKYVLNCSEPSSSREALRFCQQDCKECPDFICQPDEDTNIFRCPETDLTSKCKKRCDSIRQKGNLDMFTFECDKVFKNETDIEKCRLDCDECPIWVCDEIKNPNLYTCPTGVYEGDCRGNCEQRRVELFGNVNETGAFNISCEDVNPGKWDCQEACHTCPEMICNAFVDVDTWSCPQKKPPQPKALALSEQQPRGLTIHRSEAEPAYKGVCKARCDKFRLGGTNKYSFKCSTLFHTQAELTLCRNDCKKCPSRVCDPRVDPDKFECPHSDHHHSDEGDWKMVSTSTLFLTLCGLFVIMVVLCIVASCAYHKKRKQLRALTPTAAINNDPYEIAIARAQSGSAPEVDLSSDPTSASAFTSATTLPDNEEIHPPPKPQHSII